MKKIVSLSILTGLLLTSGVAAQDQATTTSTKNAAASLSLPFGKVLQINTKTTAGMVQLKNSSGQAIGCVILAQMEDHVVLTVKASGLTPGKHGFHIHQNPIINNDFATAGGHFNPDGLQHGAHLGDMPNLVADEKGIVSQVVHLHNVSLKKNASNSILGRSFIIHAAPDDGVTNPAGNSGARVAGGNIPN